MNDLLKKAMDKNFPGRIFPLILAVLLVLSAGCTVMPDTDTRGTIKPIDNAVEENYNPAADSVCVSMVMNNSDGTQVTVPCHPKRIVATSQHVVEMLIAIGAAETIVGSSTFTLNDTTLRPYIPHAIDIGASSALDMERVISLHPDLLILPDRYSTTAIVDKARMANISLLYMDCYRLDSHAKEARLLGKLTGHEQKAESYAQMVENTVALVAERTRNIPQDTYPRVYFESPTEYSTSGKGSSEDYIIQLAGGKNIAGGLPIQSMTVNNEWILEQNPDFILKLVYEQYLPANDLPRGYHSVIQGMEDRNGWTNLKAVQNNRIYAVNSYMKTGPRSYINLIYMAKTFHPDLFRDIDTRAMIQDYSQNYIGISNQTIVIYPDPA
jgi:iron complex transport system substrate-binding protein